MSKNIAEAKISLEPAESFIRREEGKLVISLTSRLPSIFAKEISTFESRALQNDLGKREIFRTSLVAIENFLKSCGVSNVQFAKLSFEF